MKHVRIYLTEKCNASCPWCFNKSSRNNQNMDTEKCKKFLSYCAEQWNGENLSEIDEFTKNEVKNHESVLIIPTLEGDMYASLNDYIIKGVNGEFYPCKPNIFAKTYEKVTE